MSEYSTKKTLHFKNTGAYDDGEGMLPEAPHHFWTNRDSCKGLKSIQNVDINYDNLCVTYDVLHPGLPLSLRLSFFFFFFTNLYCISLSLNSIFFLHPHRCMSLSSNLSWPLSESGPQLDYHLRILYLMTTTTFDTTGKLLLTFSTLIIFLTLPFPYFLSR